MNLKGNDFLKLLDYTPEQIDYLLRLAAQLKAEKKAPFPSRTRRLRLKRPMVLCWRRHGRAGGCQCA